jgi:hypothetical protein
MLTKLERALVLDASVRRAVDAEMDTGSALRMVAADNGLDSAEVLTAIILVRQEFPRVVLGARPSLPLDDLAWRYVLRNADQAAEPMGGDR